MTVQEAKRSEVVWLGIPAIARRLGVSPSRAYAMAAAGELPVTKVSGRLRVPLAAFELWLDQQSDRALANVREPAASR